MRFRIALRNLARNRTRTLLAVLMIAGAVSAIILFRGFSQYLLDITRLNLIRNQYGHMQVATQPYWEPAGETRKQKLLSNYKDLLQKIEAIPSVEMVSGRLSFNGLLSTGETTVSAKGISYDPSKEADMRSSVGIREGRSFENGSKFEMLVGKGLQRQLGLKLGQSISALTYTLDGVVNAADFTIVGIFSSGLDEVDNNVFFLTLQDGQMLLDTDMVDNLVIRVDKTESTNQVRDLVAAAAAGVNAKNVTKTWYELSKFYRQLESFQSVQSTLLQGILIMLILLGIMNAVGMAIYERTGEIGTIRALGETESSVVGLFTLEGALLGTLGVLVGFVLGTILSYLISASGLTIDVPTSSYPVLVQIYRPVSAYAEAAGVCLITTVIATWIPSVRAAKISIVEALKMNI